jgi:hypothetical protein
MVRFPSRARDLFLAERPGLLWGLPIVVLNGYRGYFPPGVERPRLIMNGGLPPHAPSWRVLEHCVYVFVFGVNSVLLSPLRTIRIILKK